MTKDINTHQLTTTPWYARPWPQGAQLLCFQYYNGLHKRKKRKSPIRNTINPSLGHTACICVHTCLCVYEWRKQLDTAVRSALSAVFVAATQRGKRSERAYRGFPPTPACEQLCVFSYGKYVHGKMMLVDQRQNNWSASVEKCWCQTDNWSCNMVNQSAESVRKVWGFRITGRKIPTHWRALADVWTLLVLVHHLKTNMIKSLLYTVYDRVIFPCKLSSQEERKEIRRERGMTEKVGYSMLLWGAAHEALTWTKWDEIKICRWERGKLCHFLLKVVLNTKEKWDRSKTK